MVFFCWINYIYTTLYCFRFPVHYLALQRKGGREGVKEEEEEPLLGEVCWLIFLSLGDDGNETQAKPSDSQ